MSLLRTSLPVFRRSLAPTSAVPAAMNVRGYADKPEGEFSDAYRRGESSGFSKREQASEDYYVRQEEEKKLKALREHLAKQRQHLDDVEKAIDDLSKK